MKEKVTILIGKVLIRLRKARLMSQEDLGFDAGLDRTYMNRLENNKSEPGLGTVFELADALGMKASELVKIIEESPDTEFGTRNH